MTNIKNFTKEVSKAMFLSLNSVVLAELKKMTPVDTGDTKRDWEVLTTDKPNEFIIRNERGEIVNMLESGTKAHTITPNTKKMLSFILRDKNKKPIQPNFRNIKDKKAFDKYGKIFFYGKSGKPVLGFKKEGGMVRMFAKKVKHPGFLGRFFVRDTMNDKAMWDRYEKEVNDILK